MTHILRFTCALDPLYGGVPQGISLISTETLPFGITNTIVSLGNSKDSLNRSQSNISHLRSLGVNLIFSRARFTNPYGIGGFFSAIRSLRKVEKPNLIVIHQIWTVGTLLGYLYSKLVAVNYVIMPHGSLSHYHEQKSQFIKSIARRLFVSKILSEAVQIITTSSAELEELPEELKSKTTIIPYACKDIYSKTDFSRTNQILFAGRITEKKNLDLVIRALPSLKKFFPSSTLLVAGEGIDSKVSSLKKLSSDLELNNDVVFTGWLSRDDIISAMRTSDVFVLPSEYENFCHSVMESLSCGTPVVVSRQVALSKIVEDHQAGIVIERNDPDLIALAIRDVLLNLEWYSRNAEVAATVEFAWEKVSRKWTDLNLIR